MYKHILYATDLMGENEHIIERVLALQKLTNAKVTVIHVIEPFYPYNYMMYGVEDLEKQIMAESDKELKKLGERMGVDAKNILLKQGSTKKVILEEAQKLGVDVIMCGNHGRHGLSRLLGSTANAILNHAKCDVLMVPLPE